MTSGLLFMMLLCGLGIGANAGCSTRPAACCETCPPGWTYFGGRCYVFQDSEKDWAEAEKFCNSLDGNLASLQTTEEYKFIRDLIFRTAGSNKRSWVGGNNAVQEDLWMWSDGSKFTFNAWGPGEPNNWRGKENCMDINLRGRDYVNDEVCSQKNPFVCAKDV